MWGNNSQSGFGGFGQTGNESKAGGGFFKTPSLNDSTSDKKFKTDTKKNVCQVTVRKIHSVPLTEDHVTIGGEKMSMVTICGIVVSVEEAASKIVFKLDDFTGPPIVCQHWISTGSKESATDIRSEIKENNIFRVTGSLRIADEERVILAFNVRKITDFNEYTVHMLEVIHTSMALSLVTNQASTSGAATSMMEVDTTAITEATGDGNSGFTAQQSMVLQAVNTVSGPDGAGLDFLCRKLPTMTRTTIRQALEFLSNEGHVYSTIDEEHYKATDL